MNNSSFFTALCATTIAATAVVAATPSVSGVTLAQDGLTRAVTVNYTLADASAIITLDICTNGVSIGQENIWAIDGDANKVVQPGSRSLVWHPDKSWPNQKFVAGDGIALTAVVTAWATNDPPMYLAADLVSGDVSYYTCAEAVPGGVQDILYKTTSLLMRRIYARGITWTQGSPVDEPGRYTAGPNREKEHQSTFGNDYYIGVYEVTQQQWNQMQGTWPSYFSNAEFRQARPVEQVSMSDIRNGGNDANEYPGDPASGTFLANIRGRTGLAFDVTGFGQWEYACKAGNVSGTWGDGSPILPTLTTADSTTIDPNLSRIARYAGNGGNGATVDGATIPAADSTADYGTAVVGSYEPNSWGLYDMHGNVWEQCLDISEYSEGASGDGWIADPSTINMDFGKTLDGEPFGNYVLKGGCFQRGPYRARAAFMANGANSKTASSNTRGFRLAITLP